MIMERSRVNAYNLLLFPGICVDRRHFSSAARVTALPACSGHAVLSHDLHDARASRNGCLCSTKVFQSVGPLLSLKNLEIPSINTDVAAKAETSVGSRRRAQPRTPALSLQPEQRPPRLSAFAPLPFLPSLIEARLPTSARHKSSRPLCPAEPAKPGGRTKGARGELFPPHAFFAFSAFPAFPAFPAFSGFHLTGGLWLHKVQGSMGRRGVWRTREGRE